jgi:hypothetical protein
MPIIQKENIIAMRDESGQRILCNNCMSEQDFQKVARSDIILRGTVEVLYRKGSLIFCDECDINIYRLIIKSDQKEAEKAPVAHLVEPTEQEIRPEELLSEELLPEDLEVSLPELDVSEKQDKKAS